MLGAYFGQEIHSKYHIILTGTNMSGLIILWEVDVMQRQSNNVLHHEVAQQCFESFHLRDVLVLESDSLRQARLLHKATR
jgi:hypothetical protein